MKKIVITTALFMAILGTAQAQNASHTPDTTRAYFSADGVTKADTVHNTLLYWDYDAFDEDNMDWCNSYEEGRGITISLTPADARNIARRKLTYEEQNEYSIMFIDGRAELKRDFYWAE